MDQKTYIGGLDIGTTGCKIVLFDANGDEAFTAYREYEVKRDRGLHEVDIPAVWAAVKAVLAACAPYPTAAIGVTSFGESFVILDEHDHPLAPTMLYTDPRGRAECAELCAHFDPATLALRTGTTLHEMYSLPKLMYLNRQDPTAFARAKCILLMQDFVTYMLTGARLIDHSLAARTAAFDIRKKGWIEELYAYAGIDTRLLSTPVPTGTVAGTIKPAVAAELGLPPDLTVVVGCQDQIAALIGASVLSPGEAMDGIGTVECVPIVVDEPPTDPAVYAAGYSFVPHLGGNYACYVLSYAGGATLKWFRDQISHIDYAEMDKSVPAAPTDLLVLPHFAGAATPYMDSSARAAILGLTFEHTQGDIYKALMEGTSYEIYHNLVEMEQHGYTLDAVTATGGGANSPVWLQIKADIFGIPVRSLSGTQIGAAGTALLAGRAVGLWDDSTRLISEKTTYYPDPARHETYRKHYATYRHIYPAVKEVFAHE